MRIAGELRNNNIAEYLLYMWQIEDRIRACGFNTVLLADMEIGDNGDDGYRDAVLKWYEELIQMMTAEGVRENGHLQINRNVIILLSDLHARALDSDGCGRYKQAYYAALPAIVSYRAKSGNMEMGELESCFECMYGIWLLKLQHKELSAGTADASARISAFIGILASLYSKEKEGMLDLDKEE